MADNVTINPGSGGATIATDDLGGGVQVQRVKVQHGADGSATDTSAADPFPVTASALPLPSGAATETTLAAVVAALAVVPVTDNGGSLTVDGTVAVSGSVAVTGTFYQGTQPVSAASLPLPSGAAADATLTGGTVRTKITDGTTNAAVKAASTAAVAADPTLVVTQSPNNRDAHDAAASAVGDMLMAYAKASAPSNVSADADAVRPWALLNGALCVNLTAAGALLPGDATNGLRVNRTKGTAATLANVTAATTNTQVLASGSRLSVKIWNDSTAVMYLSYGSGTPSATACTVKIAADGYFEVPPEDVNLELRAIWAAVNGAARVTTVA